MAENELVFVSGHPGRTSRQETVAELEYLRDESFRFIWRSFIARKCCSRPGAGGAKETRAGRRSVSLECKTGRKAMEGREAGLLDPELFAAKKAAEKKLVEAVAAKPELKDVLPAWEQIRSAQEILAKEHRAHAMLEGGGEIRMRVFWDRADFAPRDGRKAKPSGERLREFRDSNRKSLELRLFSEEPIYVDFETVKLSSSLAFLEETLGAGNGLVTQVLGGKSPRERAAELIAGTHLADVALRKKLYAGSAAELAAEHDPMIELARLIDPESRRLRKIEETQDEVKRQAYAKIAAARFALEKGTTYPDATFTLRLAFGTASGYEEEGHRVPFQTTFAGFYERAAAHHDKPPFDLPPLWVRRKDRLNLATPFNFVSTADIIGGKLGKPGRKSGWGIRRDHLRRKYSIAGA